MGQQASKSTPIHSTPTSVQTDEKQALRREMEITHTANRIASGGHHTKAEAGLTASKLDSWQSDFDETPTLLLSQLILSNADPKTSLISRQRLIEDQQIFNLELKGVTSGGKDGKKGVYPGPVTNQKSSGRCWLFATTNCLRYRIIPQLNLGDFQLSQAYVFFYDKLEKANFFLENTLDLVDEPLDSRILSFLNIGPVSDGGQFDMAVNIVEKYGVVPQVLYPESYSSSASSGLDHLLTSKLREFSLELRAISTSLQSSSGLTKEQAKEKARRRKEEMMKVVYNVLVITLGTPPKPEERFEWEGYDRDGKYFKLEMTPKEFYKKYTGPYKWNESFSLVNDPRNPYDKLYTVDRLGNVQGGGPIRYVNAPAEALEKAVIASIKADQPVFFGCDASGPGVREGGIWDTKVFDYEKAYGFSLSLTKAQRMETGDSVANHAMVITAVHVDEKTGRAVRYKIENSWSESAGVKGFFMCTADWFNNYTYMVVIPAAVADKKYVDILKGGNPTVLPAWDPLGTLA